MSTASLSLAWTVHRLFTVYYLIILVRVVFSFLRLPPWHWASRTIGAFCHAATEPLLAPLRHLLDPYQRRTGLDFSPLLLYVILAFAEKLVISALL